jgi:hypothetical protein
LIKRKGTIELFNIGDRVTLVGERLDGMRMPKDIVGTIIYKSNSVITRVGVEFDTPFKDGHSCGGRGLEGHCRYGSEAELKLYEEDCCRPKEFFYKSRSLSVFLSSFKGSIE